MTLSITLDDSYLSCTPDVAFILGGRFRLIYPRVQALLGNQDFKKGHRL
jgi:hypothetical protein